MHCSLWPVQTHVCSTECLNASEMRVCITKTKHCLESHTTISSKLHLDIKVSKHALNDIQEICHVTFQTVPVAGGPCVCCSSFRRARYLYFAIVMMFVCLSLCLSVCLFQANFDNNSLSSTCSETGKIKNASSHIAVSI